MPSEPGLLPFLPQQVGAKYKEQIKPEPGLSSYSMEIELGGSWLDLNDQLNFKVGGQTMAQEQVTWRKVTVESPVVEGSYTVHAVKAMVTEQVQIWVYGGDHVQVQENRQKLEQLFSRLDYRVRFSFDAYREYWRCQTAEWTTERSQVMTHNQMVAITFTVPRFPTVTTEMIA